MQTVVALIPARGGSKGIPRKNLHPLRGKPLIVHSIEQALESKLIKRVIVSTDDPEIAETARNAGAEVPFMRPPMISQDLSTDLEFMQHYIEWQESNNAAAMPDVIVQLRPTYPNRSVSFIDECITAFRADEFSSLRTVVPIDKSPFKMYTLDGPTLLPLFEAIEGIEEPYNQCRQALPPAYLHNGCVDITTPKTIRAGSMTGSRIFAKVMVAHETLDVDTANDLRRCESQGSKSTLCGIVALAAGLIAMARLYRVAIIPR